MATKFAPYFLKVPSLNLYKDTTKTSNPFSAALNFLAKNKHYRLRPVKLYINRVLKWRLHLFTIFCVLFIVKVT